MYLWVSINHFRSPDRRGYRPLACGLKSYRFLVVRSIRWPRWVDPFLLFFFLSSLSLSRVLLSLSLLFLFFFFFFFRLGVSSGRFFGVTVYIEERLEGKRGCRKRKLYRGISVDLRLTGRLSHWSVKFNGESLNILARAVRRKILWAGRNIRDIVSRVYFMVEKEFRSGEEEED